MTKQEIEGYLRKEPFEPFRLNLADGKHFDVIDPFSAVAMDTRMFLAFPRGGWTFIVLRHVTSIQSLAEAA